MDEPRMPPNFGGPSRGAWSNQSGARMPEKNAVHRGEFTSSSCSHLTWMRKALKIIFMYKSVMRKNFD